MKMKKQFLALFGVLILSSVVCFGQQILLPTADGSVFAGAKEQSYGSSNKLQIKRTANAIRHTFIKFDISKNTSNLKSAILKLHVNAITGLTQDSIAITVSHAANQDWNDESLNWTSAPKAERPITSFYISNKTGYISIDLTSFLKELAGKGDKEFTIRLSDAKSTGVLVEFASKEDKNNKPFLEIK